MPIEKIIQQSLKRQISKNEIDWTSPVDRTKHWAPVELSPLSYLPSFHQLSDSCQLRYNQLFSLGVNEYFSLFEEEFLIGCLQSLQFQKPELEQAKQLFIDDEMRHADLFHELNLRAAPEFYTKTERFYFLKQTPLRGFLLKTLTSFPRVFLVWIWAAVFFEERTLFFAQRFQQSQANIEPHFLHAHRLHMIEEVRHVSFDSHFIDEIYLPASAMLKRTASWMLKKILNRLTAPRIISETFLLQLKKEFLQEEVVLNRLTEELRQAQFARGYAELLLGEKANSRTYALMREHPEMSALLAN